MERHEKISRRYLQIEFSTNAGTRHKGAFKNSGATLLRPNFFIWKSF